VLNIFRCIGTRKPLRIELFVNIRNSSTRKKACVIKYLFNATLNCSISFTSVERLDGTVSTFDARIICDLLKT
jgi:hypothetical protein